LGGRRRLEALLEPPAHGRVKRRRQRHDAVEDSAAGRGGIVLARCRAKEPRIAMTVLEFVVIAHLLVRPRYVDRYAP
jgi:hypothetical protein